jgi:hypothetical protein
MNHLARLVLLLATVVFAATGSAVAQTSERPDLTIDKNTVSEVIDSVLSAFETHYVYPEVAKQMSAHIREKQQDNTYDTITDLSFLTRQLSRDMRAFTEDRHIRISVKSPDDFAPAIGDTVTQDKIDRRMKKNFGFRDVKWLPGNIGYVRFDLFDHPSYAGETAIAALNFMGNCDAVILDLRYNHGGEEHMVQLVASYFFKRPRQINSLYFTETDSLEQSWTYAFVPGRKLVDADLYILTSSATGSGAEAFTYTMKHHGRATVIGETTAGAAHWSEYYDFPELRVRTHIPIARPIHPVTKTSWERTGVTPHVEIPQHRALGTAYAKALQSLRDRATDERSRSDLDWHLTGAEAALEPFSLQPGDMAQYTGEFADGRYGILIKDGHLFWRYSDGTEFILVPMNVNLFGFEDDDDYRLRIVRDDDNSVTGFQLLVRGGDDSSVRPKTGDI